VGRAQPRAEAPWLDVRRAHDRVRVHAGHGPGRRPPARLPCPRAGGGRPHPAPPPAPAPNALGSGSMSRQIAVLGALAVVCLACVRERPPEETYVPVTTAPRAVRSAASRDAEIEKALARAPHLHRTPAGPAAGRGRRP